MRTLLLLGLFVGLAPALQGGAMGPPPPLLGRLARSQAVIVGKVTAFEEKTVQLDEGLRAPVEHRVAILKVEEPILLDRGITHIKLAIPVKVQTRFLTAINSLAVGQRGFFLLTRHKDGVFVAPNMYDMIAENAGNFKQHVALAKRAAPVLRDPSAGLKAKEPADRYLAASILLGRHRQEKPGHTLQPIPATESRAILQALLDADWKEGDPLTGRSNALNVFYELGATPADGWKQPDDFRQLADAARRWLKDNVEKFRIKGYLPSVKK